MTGGRGEKPERKEAEGQPVATGTLLRKGTPDAMHSARISRLKNREGSTGQEARGGCSKKLQNRIEVEIEEVSQSRKGRVQVDGEEKA